MEEIELFSEVPQAAERGTRDVSTRTELEDPRQMAQKPLRGRGDVPAPHTWECEQKIKIKVALRSLTAKAKRETLWVTQKQMVVSQG